jgi:kinesin family protein 3/17
VWQEEEGGRGEEKGRQEKIATKDLNDFLIFIHKIKLVFCFQVKATPPLRYLPLFSLASTPSGKLAENVQANAKSCTVCGQSWSDPNVPHLCERVKAVLDYQAAKKARQAAQNKPIKAKSSEHYSASENAGEKSVSSATSAKALSADMASTPLSVSASSPRSALSSLPNATTSAASQLASSSAPLDRLDIPTPTSIQVFIRIRPLLSHESDEESRGATSVIDTAGTENTVHINHPAKQLQCQYDHVFNPSASQESIFSKVSGCADALAAGYNATIFAYGQTGSGKTHTMFGPDGYQVSRSSYGGPNLASITKNAGVIPRSIVQIFKSLGAKNLGITQLSVYVSFVQVYNENLYDMLRDPRRSSALEIHEEPGQGIYVSGLSEYAVRNAGDCLALVKLGEENRAIRETHMNTASSRSHSLFQIVVEQTRIEDGAEGERKLKSKFNLVDLAGSEKWDTRKDSLRNEDQIQELTNINLSLYTLGRCIAALAKNGKALKDDPDAIPGHIPFRESKLTRLLQDSLGGNSKTMLIATLSPASDCLDETVSTLRFADRAHQVMTFVRKNEKRPVDHALVQRLQSEVARLRALLDERGAGGGGGDGGLSQSINLLGGGGLGGSPTPAGGGNVESSPEYLRAIEKIKDLATENNSLRRRLGMTEIPVSVATALDGQQRLGTPQRHTPRGLTFAIVGGGNSEVAAKIKQQHRDMGGGSEETKASLNAMRGSHERLSSIMNDVDGVTSRFFAFDIEEDELKEKVQKLMKVYKKEKKSFVELYRMMDEGSGIFNAHSAPLVAVAVARGGGGGGEQQLSPSPKKDLSGPPSGGAGKFNSHINNSPSFRPPVVAGYNATLPISSSAAGNVGVAYRIRGKGDGGGGSGAGAQTLSPQKKEKLFMSGPASLDGGSGGGGMGDWIQSEEDEEAKLRKELKAAKARMQKQIQMQDWLEKKEAKALEAFEAEEEARKKFQDDAKERDKQFRKRAKNQKKKLEKYYNKLREEMGAMDIEAQREGGIGGGGGMDASMDENDLDEY